MRIFGVASISLALFLATACSNSADSHRYYDLGGFLGQSQDNSTGIPVRVNPVTLPPYLDSQSILFQTGPDELIQTNSHRWVSNLSELLTSTLVLGLRNEMPKYSFGESICSQGSVNCPTLKLNVRDFRGIYNGTVHVEFDWSVTQDQKLLCHGSVSKTETQKDSGYEALVKTLNSAWKNSISDLTPKLTFCIK